MRTENVDLVLSHITADEYSDATEELARYLEAGLTTTRELLAGFNDLNNECLTRWPPSGDRSEAGGLPKPPPGTTELQPPSDQVVPSRPQLRLLS